jgi:hypothetical protein
MMTAGSAGADKNGKLYSKLGTEVLTVLVMNTYIVWDIMPCSPLKVNRRFGRTCRLHLQGQTISQVRNQSEKRWQAEFAWFILRP